MPWGAGAAAGPVVVRASVLALVTQHGNNKDAAHWDAQVPQP